jgi:hypothetical protein
MGVKMALTHERYTSGARIFSNGNGQKTLKAIVGQRNVLDGKDYKPYVWDAQNLILKFHDSELHFLSDRLRLYRKEFSQNFDFAFHPENKAQGNWERKSASKSSLTINEFESDRATTGINITFKLITVDQEASISIYADASGHVDFGLQTKALKAGTLRLTMEHTIDGEIEEIEGYRNKSNPGDLRLVGYRFTKLGYTWSWTYNEAAERTILKDSTKVELHLNEADYTLEQIKKTSPDSIGPIAVGANADDAASDVNGYCSDGSGSPGGCDQYQFFIDDGDPSGAWHNVGFRFTGIDLEGQPASIDGGTQLTCDNAQDTTDTGDTMRIYAEQAQDPSQFADSGGARPHDKTKTTNFDTWIVSNTAHHDIPCIDPITELISDGYSYDGTGGNDTMVFLLGGADFGGGNIGYAEIACPYEGCNGGCDGCDPVELTIVYTADAGTTVPVGKQNLSLAINAVSIETSVNADVPVSKQNITLTLLAETILASKTWVWGHDTAVDEDSKEDLGDGTTDADITGSDDAEKATFEAGEYWESPTKFIGAGDFKIGLNKYQGIDPTGFVVKYKTGATETACNDASWTEGSSFTSTGWGKIRIEY